MIDLKPYVNRRVIVHLKQPYCYQLVRSDSGKAVPFAVIQSEDGKLMVAPPTELRAKQLTAEVLCGTVVQQEDRYLLEMNDPTSSDMIEVAITPEVVQFVSAVRKAAIVTLGG